MKKILLLGMLVTEEFFSEGLNFEMPSVELPKNVNGSFY